MKIKLQQYFSTKWPAIIWSVIVFILLVIPPAALGSERKIEIVQLDKVIHFFLFGIVAALWTFYIRQRQNHFLYYLLIFICTSIYGIATEYVQDWVGRDFDVWDMFADAAGAFVFVSWVGIKRRPR
ncbi:hypothetical protein ESA94_12480 [Lacibacter luteus]|uniref:Uncharacterized protein n=1 Tax=Lacibacter luteus TaxID=2508719 RepID=A0A4Q1CIH0_9BACT|nr:VanZ family protein [Lacibacter luteus]RXK59864.1 hypothetical protein ESA94_12480 [Lacibacter luteus]